MYLLFGVFLFSMVIGTGLYLTRHTWLPLLPERLLDIIYSIPAPGSSSTSSARYSFLSDAESGFHSSNFDLAENIEGSDGRAGLNEEQKREVTRIMKSRGITFDQARTEFMQKRFRAAGIGADGLPRDPKLVTFGGR